MAVGLRWGLLGLLACLTVRQQAVWASNVTLWAHAVSITPTLARPALNLATAYRQSGQSFLAVIWFERAGQLADTDPRRAEYRRSIAAQLQWMDAFGDPVCGVSSVRQYCWP